MDRPSIGAGEVVPSVNASEVRSVWELFEKNRSRFPVQQFAVGLGAIQRVCSPDADVSAVGLSFCDASGIRFAARRRPRFMERGGYVS